MPWRMLIKAITFAAVVLFATSAGATEPPEPTIVAVWNNAALAEVRMSKLGPPVAARALAIAHTCMYDAWAAYDQDAVGTTDLGGQRRRPPGERHDDNKKQAISFAAYRCLVNLFTDSDLFPATGANAALRLEAVMVSQGYDPTNNSTVTTTPDGIGIPAAIGNVAARAVIDARSGDGSNQYGDLHPGAYSDYTGYTPRNPPMGFCTPLLTDCPELVVYDPDHWQPLIGPPPPDGTSATQQCIGAHWENVTPFALTSYDQFDTKKLAPPPDIFQNGNY